MQHTGVSHIVRRTVSHALAIAALLHPLTAAAQSAGTVTGHVVDETGAPVQGASVLLVGTQAGGTVHADGSYRFTAPAGRYGIVARLIGYGSRADSITIVAGSTVTKDFTMSKAVTSLGCDDPR